MCVCVRLCVCICVCVCVCVPLKVLMYLRSAKDKRTDVPGDVSLLPTVTPMPDWPLKTPVDQLMKAAAGVRGVRTPRGEHLFPQLCST